MSGYVEVLEQAGNDPISALHRFRTLAARGIGIHLFIEGNADRYLYPSVVRQHTDRRLIVHEVDGYSGVFSAHADVESLSFKDVPRLYFVDRDLSFTSKDRLGASPDIYCTPNYSVESFLYQLDTVVIAANEIDNLDSDSPHLDVCWDLVKDNACRTAPLIRAFMALTLAARAAGQTPNLNNVSLRALGLVGANGVVSVRGTRLSHLARQAGIDCLSIDRNSYRFWRSMLRSRDLLLWYRGKYLAELVALSIKKYFVSRREVIPPNRKGKAFKAQMSRYSPDDLMQACLPRIRVPKCLLAYVETRIAEAA